MKVGYISTYDLNFGDSLNEPILNSLVDDNIEFVYYNRLNSLQRRISAIGSIGFLWTGNTVVWGSGLLDERATFIKGLPDMDFRCVRGPKTRKFLLDLGYDIPEVYGDPGVLAPYFYRNVISKRKIYDIGIFAHKSENPEWHKLNSICHNYAPGVYISYKEQVDKVIFKISQCKRIVTSSLHALIIAEVLGIPVSWYRLTDEENPFKFQDYFESTGRIGIECIDIRRQHLKDVDFTKFEFVPQEGNIDFKGLLDSFPFKMKKGLKEDILNYYES